MRIGLKEIDPKIAQAFAARVAEDCYPTDKYLHAEIDWKEKAAEGKRVPTPEEQAAYEHHCRREDRYAGWTAFTLFLPLVSGGVVGFQQGVIPGLAAWLAPVLFGAWQMKRTAARTQIEREISPTELRAVIPLINLNGNETLYCQALLQLLEAPTSLDEGFGRDILRNMNELLARDREIASQLEQVDAAIAANPLDPLEAERNSLEERLSGAADEIERASLEQTLRLCEARLDHARALHSAPRRLEAQRGAIHEALKSIPVALVRKSASATAVEEPEVQAITETIAEIAQNAYSEEQAVAEVLALRSG